MKAAGKAIKCGVLSALSIGITGMLAAQTWTGAGTSARWGDAGNWAMGVVPADGADVEFLSGNDSGATVQLAGDRRSGEVVLHNSDPSAAGTTYFSGGGQPSIWQVERIVKTSGTNQILINLTWTGPDRAPNAPAAPTVRLEDGAWRIEWSAQTAEPALTQYRLQRRALPDGNFADIAILDAASTVYVDDSIPDPQICSHEYRLIAINAGGESPASEAGAPVFWYVDPEGDDANDGQSLATPFRTLGRAAAVAEAGAHVFIRAGVYRETLRPAYSGTASQPISFVAWRNASGAYETVTIDGTDPLSGPWRSTAQAGVYACTLPSSGDLGLGRNQLFVGETMQVEARWPNIDGALLLRETLNTRAVATAATSPTPETAIYTLPALASAAYTVDQLTGALANVTIGYHWVLRTATVTGNDDTALSLAFYADVDRQIPQAQAGSTLPQAQNRIFLWGKRDFLDSDGEWFREADVSNPGYDTLYFQPENGQSPEALPLSIRAREYAIDFRDRTHLRVEGLRLFAATYTSNGGTEDIALEALTVSHIGHDYDMIRSQTTAQAPRVFGIAGQNQRVENCNFRGLAHGIILTGRRHTFRQNIVTDSNYIFGIVIDQNYQSQWGTIPPPADPADFNRIEHNTIRHGSYGLISAGTGYYIRYNDAHHSHLQFTDTGIINSWGTDGNGTTIAFNYVHDAHGLLDHSLKLWGGHGIYFDHGTQNYLVHNNVVWETTSGGIHLQNASEGGFDALAGVDVQRHIYHNTVDGEISTAASTDPSANFGTILRNNFARFMAQPVATNLTFGGNSEWIVDAAPVQSPSARDYRPLSSAAAIDLGETLTEFAYPYTLNGSGPDAGAYEYHAPWWVAGAVIEAEQLADLGVAPLVEANGTVRLTVTGIPSDRKLPTDFQARIGTADFGGNLSQSTDYVTQLTTAELTDVPAPTERGLYSIEIRIASEPTRSYTLPVQIDTTGLTISGLSEQNGLTDSPESLTLSGGHFAAEGAQVYERAITLENNYGSALYHYPVEIEIDTAQLIAAGKIRLAGDNLKFTDGEGDALPYWIESGWNTASTRIWVRPRKIPTGSSTLSLFYGYTSAQSAASGAATFYVFEDFEDGQVPDYIRKNGDAEESLSIVDQALNIRSEGRSADPYSASGGFYFDGSKYRHYPTGDYAITSDFNYHTGPANYQIGIGGDALKVIGGTATTPKYYAQWVTGTGWVDVGQSTLTGGGGATATMTAAFHGSAGARQVFAFENAETAPRATLSVSDTTDGGGFLFAPATLGQPYEWSIDNLRVRPFVYPEPSATVGVAETPLQNAMKVLFAGVEAQVSFIDDGTLIVTPPSVTAPLPTTVSITVIHPDGAQFSFSDAYTYRQAMDFWRYANFGHYDPQSGSGVADDPDRDGIANLAEYAFGCDPLQPDAASVHYWTAAEGPLQLRFPRLRDDLTYTIEGSTDLQSWNVLATNPGSLGTDVTFTDTSPPAPETPRFLRLRIE